jgi:uncharacterized protein (DUF885 family)
MNRRIMMIGSACAAAFAAVRALPQGSDTSQGSDASKRLNALFDFHDAMLLSGAMPLELLERTYV